MNIFDLVGADLRLAALLEETGGEETAEVAALLEAMGGQTLESKVDAYRQVIDTLTALAKNRKERAAKLAKTASGYERACQRLRERLLQALKLAGKDSLKTALGTASVVTSKEPHVEYDGDLEDLPRHLVKTELKLTLKKDAVLYWLKSGQPLPPRLKIEEGRQHLRLD